ncbi:hypothetical protein EJB05_54387, partial [Eragrostis curvula]
MALHRFRGRTLSLILRSQPSSSASHDSPVVSLNRLLCSAATAASSAPSPRSFAVEDYLVSRCGLTPAQALKATKKIPHLSSRSNPDAVLAFLGGTLWGHRRRYRRRRRHGPEVPLRRRGADHDLYNLGLSRDEVARLIPFAPCFFHSTFLGRNLEFWLNELGSFDKLLRAVRMNSALLNIDPDKATEPNMALLRQCGLNASDLLASNIYAPRLFTMNPERLREAVERVEELGVQRGARMFPRALVLISLRSKEAYARRVRFLQKFGFSHDEVREILRKAPFVLSLSDQKIQGNVVFLMKDVGLDVPYIARRPVLLLYSVERRLLPRHWLLKSLKEKGLLIFEFDFYGIASKGEKLFLEKFVLPYKDLVPGLAEDYASKCSGRAVDIRKSMRLLQKFGFSQDDVREVVRKAPFVLSLSDQKIQGNMDFLMKDVGLEPPYIGRRPALIMYSYYVEASMAERDFLKKFVLPYKDTVPVLADGCASNVQLAKQCACLK